MAVATSGAEESLLPPGVNELFTVEALRLLDKLHEVLWRHTATCRNNAFECSYQPTAWAISQSQGNSCGRNKQMIKFLNKRFKRIVTFSILIFAPRAYFSYILSGICLTPLQFTK